MNDMGKAFTFPFRDPDWPSKFLLAALFMFLSIFGIGIPVVAGYLVQVTQRVMRREQRAMPDWSDPGVKFILGFKFCIVWILYVLPLLLLYVPFLFLALLNALAEEGQAVEAVASVYALTVILLVAVPYGLFLTLVSPFIAYRFAERERIIDALDIVSIFRDLRDKWQQALIIVIISMGLSFFSAFGIILFLVGVLFTMFYSYLVIAYMNGLLYLEPRGERK